MAKAAQPAIASDEILFELERFELVDRRLVMVGRWFGVRGRRFVRPTLTPLGGRDRSRVLADLEHKPWAAEDGDSWEAAFAWDRDGRGSKFELSVSPDIVIQLPSPSAKLTLPRRFAALPRRPSITAAAWPQPQPDPVEDAPAAAPEPPSRPEPPVQLGPTREDFEELATHLEASRAELEVARAELAAVATARDLAANEAAAAIAARDRLATERTALTTERDALRAGHAELTVTRGELEGGLGELQAASDVIARERDQLAGELAVSRRTVDELRSELELATAAVQEATRERDEMISTHGAALVMRRATRAAPYQSHGYSGWRAAVAIVALVVVVFAILIVAGVL